MVDGEGIPFMLLFVVTIVLGTMGNIIVLFAFISVAVKQKRFAPLDRVIVNKTFVNLLLCFYQGIPRMLTCYRVELLQETGCIILVYLNSSLRCISIWSVSNLSFLHLIKIKRPNWALVNSILSHQSRYVNVSISALWLTSFTFYIPYTMDKIIHLSQGQQNHSVWYLPSASCNGLASSSASDIVTYISVSLDLLAIVWVVVLNALIIQLLCKHQRRVGVAGQGLNPGNKTILQATRILVSLLCIYVTCWISNDIVWIMLIANVRPDQGQNQTLKYTSSLISSLYYTASSYVLVFGHRNVKDVFIPVCRRLKQRKAAHFQDVEI
ncbi:taste receptor type 2 member 136-like [Hemiscyllium ocellatum]|uniref:taste receptor type 2 member 136-like n=1 Tax=Hemiscyllium ocellatum TaxID=170820 RepID=UPI0029672B4B|nr:taste receptor type 2 member 136-like [Hemiscyllium ocellatum]